jgi:hypothetical protein
MRAHTIPNEYRPILDLYQEILKAQDADALVAALAMVFVGIDTLAWLSLPIGSKSVKRNDFCSWIDTYLKTDADQPYQYVGIDVYAARCAMLHSYGSQSNSHRTPNPPKTFGYLDNGPHRADGSPYVLISIAVLIRDFGRAIRNFLESAKRDTDLKDRIDSRIKELVAMIPVALN